MRYAGSRHETVSGRGPWIFGNWITSSSWHSWGVSPRRPTIFLSRQALSKAVRNLEHELGQPLLANRDNHLELTDAGRTLLDDAAPVVEAFKQLERRHVGLRRSPALRRTLWWPWRTARRSPCLIEPSTHFGKSIPTSCCRWRR
ncbi:MAG: LysR family transcriptional regulator [Adlercreutzia equolifaciens]